MDIQLKVNGQAHRLQVEPRALLADVLRDQLRLTGTHIGCDTSQCGCCTVLLDGRAIQSCATALETAEGRSVTTIEGLGTDAAPHPLQQAFIEEQAGQCGYCLSGFIMGAAALLARNPNPSDAEIRSELDVHLCRCGAYDRIHRAIRRASQAMERRA